MRQVNNNPKCWCGESVDKWLCLDPATALLAHTGDGLGLVRTEKNPLSFSLARAGMDRTPMRETHALSTFSMVHEMNWLFGKRGNFCFGCRSPRHLRMRLAQE